MPAAESPLLGTGERIARRILTEDNIERNYRADLALEALLELGSATGKPEYRAHVLSVLERRGVKPETRVPWRSQPFGCLTFAVFRATGDRAWLPGFLAETELCRKEIRRSPEGAITHPRGAQRGGGEALLIDAMQAYAARMTDAGAVTGEAAWSREAVEQYNLYRSLLRDSRTGLWSQGRGWVGDQPAALSPGAWSRGHGWLLRGLTACLAETPPDSAGHARLRELLHEFFEALAPLQKPDGMWPTLLHRPASESPPDSSGTAMMAAAFSRAWREGWLPDPRARDCARRAFAALPGFVDADGIVLSTSPGPGPLESETDYLATEFPPGNDHGTFAIIFAAAESARLETAPARH